MKMIKIGTVFVKYYFKNSYFAREDVQDLLHSVNKMQALTNRPFSKETFTIIF